MERSTLRRTDFRKCHGSKSPRVYNEASTSNIRVVTPERFGWQKKKCRSNVNLSLRAFISRQKADETIYERYIRDSRYAITGVIHYRICNPDIASERTLTHTNNRHTRMMVNRGISHMGICTSHWCHGPRPTETAKSRSSRRTLRVQVRFRNKLNHLISPNRLLVKESKSIRSL